MYPYHRPDLLVRKESYEYADCKGAAYYQSWIQSREAAVTRLRNQVILEQNSEPESSSAVLLRLDEIKALLVSRDFEEAKTLVQPMVKQFEITRKLKVTAAMEVSFKLCSEAQILKHYVLFSEVLLDLAEVSSLQFLSTALKVNDALVCIDFGAMRKSDKDALVSVILREISIVDRLRQ